MGGFRPFGAARYRIRTRFLLFFSYAVIMCAALIALVSASYYPRVISDRERRSDDELLAGAAGRVGDYMAALDNMAYPLMLNRSIQSVLDNTRSAQNNSYLAYVALNNCNYALQLQANIHPELEIALFPTEAGKAWFSSLTNSRAAFDYAGADWWQAFGGNPALMRQFLPNRGMDIEYGQSATLAHQIAYRVKSLYSMRTIGYMCLYLRGSALAGMLGDISENIRALALVDGQGAAICSEGDAFSPEELTRLAGAPEAAAELKRNGGVYRVSGCSVPGTDWRLLCAFDCSALRQASRRVNRLIFATAAAVGLFCILILRRSLMRMLRPIEQLSYGMEQVRMGRLDCELEADRADELGQAVRNFNDMARQLEQADRDLRAMEALQREISIAALRQQINPHFLYNTLDMIIGMTAEGNGEAVIEVCKALGGMFRFNLNGDSRVPLRVELTQIRRYLQINQHRFHGRFTVELNVDETLLDQVVPKLMLQPIVENSVIHGVSAVSRQVTLWLDIRRAEAGRFAIVVRDDGAGMSAETLEALRRSLAGAEDGEPGGHIGLRNVYGRLRLEYGEAMEMTIDSEPQWGTRVTLLLPERTTGQVEACEPR